MERNSSLIQRLIIGLIRGYQLAISPMFPASCRFYPSCSQYAVEAVRIHGALHGSLITFKRVCRCNPWGNTGIDPVPQRFVAKNKSYDSR